MKDQEKTGTPSGGSNELPRYKSRAEEALRTGEETSRELTDESAAMAEIGRIISSSLDVGEVYVGDTAGGRRPSGR